MSHTSEKRWSYYRNGDVFHEGIGGIMGPLLKDFVEKLVLLEESYQQMQEMYTYAGGTASGLAALLFKEDIEVAGSPYTPTQEQIDIATDAVAAMAAAHQLYQAASNVSVTQSDRLTDLRRMI